MSKRTKKVIAENKTVVKTKDVKPPKIAKVKEQAKVDKFGSRPGSKSAKINACLSKQPKTMKQLLKETGLESTFYNHVNVLIAKHYVVKTKDGAYKLQTK
jgi:hypothetical protein